MDSEALAQQFIVQSESADAEHVVAQRAFASGEFDAYWQQKADEAIKRMEDGYNDSEIS